MSDFYDLIKDKKDKGLIHVSKEPVLKIDKLFRQIETLADTEPMESDNHWWGIRAYLLAHDMTREKIPLYDTDITSKRMN